MNIFVKKISRLDMIFGMELVLCMTPIFRPVQYFLLADGREHPCPMDTFVFYLYLLTINLIIHMSVVIWRSNYSAILAAVKLPNFPCNGNCRVVTILSDRRTIELSDHRTVGLKSCQITTTHSKNDNNKPPSRKS